MIGIKRILREEANFSYCNAVVAEVEGRVAATVLAYRPPTCLAPKPVAGNRASKSSARTRVLSDPYERHGYRELACVPTVPHPTCPHEGDLVLMTRSVEP